MSTHPKQGSKPREDLTGRTFDRWKVISDERNGEGRRTLCKCACGVRRFVDARSLTRCVNPSRGCRECYPITTGAAAAKRVAPTKARAPAKSARWMFQRAHLPKPGTFIPEDPHG